MPLDITIAVPIPPRGKQRSGVRVVDGHARFYKRTATRRWEKDLAVAFHMRLPGFAVIDSPVRVCVLAVVARPKRLLRRADPDGLLWCTSLRGFDCDNTLKAIMDGLKPFWRDDSLVVDASILKLYAEREGKPRVVIRIRSAEARPDGRVADLFGVGSEMGGEA